ncbi:MAG: DUF2497 domain-containing protein, partial [Bradyrhizobium sp.]
ERRATTAPETKLEPHPAAPAPAGSHALPAPEKGVAGHPPAEANKPAVEEKRAAPAAEPKVEPRPAPAGHPAEEKRPEQH